jgi:outer membrane protein assembly factor BamB
VGDGVYHELGYYGGLAAARAANGEYLWWANLSSTDHSWMPAHDDGTLYTFVGGIFRAHNPATGYVRWSLDLGVCEQLNTLKTAPAISGGTAVVTCADDLNAINLGTHALAWTAPGNYQHTTAAADGVVYAIRAGVLEERGLVDGALRWSLPGTGWLVNAPVLAGNHLYVASAEQTYVADRTTHAITWQVDHGGWLAVADGFLYVGQADNAIYAYRAQEP